MLNYYTILRVTENASSEEIKSAYRTLAKEYHPDINPNSSIAEEYFKKVNEAYSVLSDPIKRNWYNLLLKGNTVTNNIDPRKYGTRRTSPSDKPASENLEEESTTPFWIKQLLPLMSMVWCLLIIYNNWFSSYEGAEEAKIAFAFLLFIGSSYFFINNLYNKWRIEGSSFNPESRSLNYYLMAVFLTIPLFFVLGYARKSIQLKLYPAITEARIVEYRQRFEEYWVSVLYFTDDNIAYTKDFIFTSPVQLKRTDYKILIRYSTLEPKIMQFHIQLNEPLKNLQPLIDDLNDTERYYR